ncbi:MAG: signal recognition particle-docking protein FtsY [Rhizobiales bacterium]|nr:signal recognition particle-docking protein FtsY [Hyphomicrobiales bacterium]
MNEKPQKKAGLFSRLFGESQPRDGARASEEARQRPAEEAPAAASVISDEGVPASSDESGEIVGRNADAVAELAPAPEQTAPQRKSWFQRLTDGLARTSSQLASGITGLFTKRKLDAATLEELEDLLIQADLGVETASAITEALAKDRFDKEISPEEVKRVLAEEVRRVLEPVARPLVVEASRKPHVILVVGVNGSGKTTTIGKLAKKFTEDGRKVMLAAGDTFRAAAIEQLEVWGKRSGVPVVARAAGSDASGLAYEALESAQAAAADVLLIDTAGRLQNKTDLMAELQKIVRVLRKLDPTGPHDVLLVLDATTGQNAMRQAEVFREIAGVTGLVMTKLDGTARGGILVAIAARHAIAVHAIGVGEGIEDLRAFDANDFALAIAGMPGEATPGGKRTQ